MLTRSFCHIPGISERKERELWSHGILSWDHLLSEDAAPFLSPALRRAIDTHLPSCCEAYNACDIDYFARHLPRKHLWRLFPYLRDRVVYLDIETTGHLNNDNHITTVVLYDGITSSCFVHGVSLHDLPACLAQYDLVVTYNGASFDLPYIKKEYDVALPLVHIDLCHLAHSLGIKGGLKKTERILGIERQGLEDLDGYHAVILWQMYTRTRDPRYLETLLAYNAADSINLETLMITLYNLKLRDVPAPPTPIPLPHAPPLPYAPDPNVVHSLRTGSRYYY